MNTTGTEPALVWFGDHQASCAGCNRTWLDWRGRLLDEELGTGWLDGVHPQDRAHCAMTLARSTALRTPVELEFRLQRHDGLWRPMLSIGVPRVDHSGEFAGLTCALIDATEHLRARRTGRAAQALLHATLEAAQDSSMVGTAEGASVHRIATFIAADRPHAVDHEADGRAGVTRLSDVTAFDPGQRRRAGHDDDVAVVACALEPVGEPMSHWMQAELQRHLIARLTANLRARDTVVDCADGELAVMLSGVSEDRDAQAVIDVLHEVLEHPLEVGGRPIHPSLRFTYVMRQAGEDLPACVDRARQALGPAVARAR